MQLICKTLFPPQTSVTITFLTYSSYTSQSIAVVTTATFIPVYLLIAHQSCDLMSGVTRQNLIGYISTISKPIHFWFSPKLSVVFKAYKVSYNRKCPTLPVQFRNSQPKPLKVRSRQNLKNRMDVRREFYLQKKNILATMLVPSKFELKISGYGRHWNRQWFQVEPEREVVEEGLCYIIYSPFPVLLFNFILVFVIVTFWAWTKNTMVCHCVSEWICRSKLLTGGGWRQTNVNMMSLMTEQHSTENWIGNRKRNFLHENSMRIIFFLNTKFNCEF